MGILEWPVRQVSLQCGLMFIRSSEGRQDAAMMLGWLCVSRALASCSAQKGGFPSPTLLSDIAPHYSLPFFLIYFKKIKPFKIFASRYSTHLLFISAFISSTRGWALWRWGLRQCQRFPNLNALPDFLGGLLKNQIASHIFPHPRVCGRSEVEPKNLYF